VKLPEQKQVPLTKGSTRRKLLYMNSFGAVLREKRRTAELSQRQLARLTGVDFTYISKLENDRLPSPALETIYRLAEALGCRLEALLVAAKKVPAEVNETLAQPEALQFFREACRLRLSPREWESLTGSLKHLR
jgi:transcriptional regulator with XRE-family HTH domain